MTIYKSIMWFKPFTEHVRPGVIATIDEVGG